MKNQNFSANSIKGVIKSLDNFLYGIASNVICTICQELFFKAVTNQCGHSFCSKCIKRFQTTSKYKKVNCPLCRYPIKYRAGTDNSVLSKLAEICSEASEALKEDVKKVTKNFEDAQKELIKNMRISSICEEKFKDDEVEKRESKQLKKNDGVDVWQLKSNDSLVLSSVVDDEEVMDLKSISQIESKSETRISESPLFEKRSRNVRIVTREKVSNWLQNVNKSVSTSPDSSHLENAKRGKLTEANGSNVTNLGKSMIRIDYLKSKKSNDICIDKTSILGENGDPYEFIPSQKNTSSKRKRKRTGLQFERIHSFDKKKLRKHNYKNNAIEREDEGPVVAKIQKSLRTYGTRSNRKKITNESGECEMDRDKIITRKPRGYEFLGNKESCIAIDIAEHDSDGASKNKTYSRGQILSSYSDISDSVDSYCLSNQKVDDDDGDGDGCGTNENIRKSPDNNKYSQSPGWSRVTNLKMDFENAMKRCRPCRKTLDISGGDININATKMKSSADILSESKKNILIPNEKYSCTGDLIQKSNLLDQNREKLEFKVNEENTGKEPERTENICDKVHVGSQPESNIMTNAASISNNVAICRAGNRNTIQFELLGKIKKKRNMSIVFVKMGRLSPFLTKSGRTIVKLVFPSVNRQKTSIKVQTNKLGIDTDTTPLIGNFHLKATGVEKVDVGVQSNPDPSCSKEIQTFLEKETKSVIIQTDMSISSHILKEIDKPTNEVEIGNDYLDNELNTELQCELNKTWAVTQAEMFNSAALTEKDRKIIVSSGNNELINPAIDNKNLNPITMGNVHLHSISIKSREVCEESDSDIFIEQTPPRIMPIDEKENYPIEEDLENVEENFLILSECQSNIPDQDKPKLESVKKTENDKNNLNQLKLKSQDSMKDRKLCIVSSGIRNQKLIEKFVKRFKIEHSSFPKKEMTHLIVGLHENEDYESVPYCTPKFLYAIANKKWIVTESWIEECLKSKEIVREEPFESVDPIGGNGCNIARISTGFLLDNWEIYLYGEFVTIAKGEFAELIQDCGGTIIPRLKDFSFTENKIRMILLDGSALQKKKEEYEILSKRYRTLVMSKDVAIMSIQSYQTVNFTPFVQHQFSTDECIKWGYPLHLVKKDINLDDSNADGLTY